MKNLEIKIIMPVFNDWDNFKKVAEEIYQYYQKSNYDIELIVVNDSSDNKLEQKNFNSFKITLINLLNNVGNQRAIAHGIKYVVKNFKEYDYTIVMDSDGEDKVEDIKNLIEECKIFEGKNIIFAQRKKRYENFTFKLFYFIYKKIFKLLTGKIVDFGNFSCIPKNYLKKIALLPGLKLHYCCSVLKSNFSYKKISCNKGKRLFGGTNLSLSKHITHGLNSLSLFVDIIAAKIFFISILSILGLFLFSIIITISKIIFTSALVGWTSTMLMSILIIFSILFLSCMFSLFILWNKNNYNNSNSETFFEDLIENIEILEKQSINDSKDI